MAPGESTAPQTAKHTLLSLLQQTQSQGAGIGIGFHFMLPKSNGMPAKCYELSINLAVSFFIALNLQTPELGIGLR